MSLKLAAIRLEDFRFFEPAEIRLLRISLELVDIPLKTGAEFVERER